MPNIYAALADGHDLLDLVVQVFGGEGIGDLRIVWHNRIRRLAEKEGRLAIRVVTHFSRMLGIISANAVNAVHREQVGCSLYRNGGLRFGRNNKAHMRHLRQSGLQKSGVFNQKPGSLASPVWHFRHIDQFQSI